MSSPPVPVVDPPEPPQALTLVCANCGSALEGEYCAACGQRHEPHLHTVAHFAAEALESISHADSRLWKTLWYLLSRPGFLTREFFEGKRVRYLPPFRLYLVISVVFFLSLGSPKGPMFVDDSDLATMDADETKALAEQYGKDAAAVNEALKKAQEIAREKAAEESDEAEPKPGKGLAKQNAMTEFCDEFKADDPRGNKNYERLQKACAKVANDNGAGLIRAIVHNIPKAMFVFLPLLALAMKPLYWRPKRYYVEHLLFLIHNHAFVFLVLAILAFLEKIPRVGDHLGLLEFATWIYIAWYLYRGMRNVYQQRRAITVAKYFAVGFFYLGAASTVLVLTALFSAMIA
jgi:hypothetical protein